jgi:quercetin dioxygenase-like cupin family protein
LTSNAKIVNTEYEINFGATSFRVTPQALGIKNRLMNKPSQTQGLMPLSDKLSLRLVRYTDLVPCYNAFIDTRSPGSSKKENFTIIGPGVSENPDQYVHIAEPHGFNIGGARQPPNCVNSQHSHETAELFVVHTGQWSFNIGEFDKDAKIILNEGDVISIPTHMFRGFENIGKATGFLWAVLGGDDPGHVVWAPSVFDMAKDYGLILLEDGTLIDTIAGQTVPEGARPMPRTTPEQVAAMDLISPSDTETIVVRAETMDISDHYSLVGPASKLNWPHGFTLERFTLHADTPRLLKADQGPYVLFVQSGQCEVHTESDEVTMGTGDTLSVPAHLSVSVLGSDQSVVFVVRAQ